MNRLNSPKGHGRVPCFSRYAVEKAMLDTAEGVTASETTLESAPATPISAAPPAPPPRGKPWSVFGALGHGLPTVFVLAALGGLAWWGHEIGWQMPKFS